MSVQQPSNNQMDLFESVQNVPSAPTTPTAAPNTNSNPLSDAIDLSTNLSTLFMDVEELEYKTTPFHDRADHLLTDEDDFSAPAGEFLVNVEVLETTLKFLTGVITEGRMAVAKDGWYFKAVDPANVQMICLHLDRSDFIDYSLAEQGTLGINLDRLKKTIGQMDRSDTVTITIDATVSVDNNINHEFDDEFSLSGADLSTLDMPIEEIGTYSERPPLVLDDGFRSEVQTIDPKSIRSVPDIPDLDLTSEVTLPGLDMKELLKRADNYSDHISVSAPREGTVKFMTEGDSDTLSKEYTDKSDLITTGKRIRRAFEVNTTEGDESLFSREYFENVFTALRKSKLKNPYTIRFGHEFPSKITTEIASSSKMMSMVAPRILS